MTAQAPALPPLPVDVRRRITARACAQLGWIVALAAAPVAAFAVLGKTALALGTGVGFMTGALCGISWLVGSLVAFDAAYGRLSRSTIGMAPVRLFLVLGSIIVAAKVGADVLDPLAFTFSFVVTRLAFHIVEAATLGAFADAARATLAPAPAPPDPAL